ncbi:MAG TPA: group I intron-associated PD-(D/E)XK endonuclease [Bacilli bacterium]|nr:group I intron-associated PD-(D/E)XK endonuclease [Bacilli bacterium]
MTTKQVGAIGEAYAKYHLTKLGYNIFSPDVEDSEYDFIAVREGVFIPIQVKTTQRVINNTMVFDFRKTRSNTKVNIAKKYDQNIVFVLVCLENMYIGCIISSQSCLKIRLDSSKTINQYNPNFSENYILTEKKLMSCVETLYAAPKS